MLTSIVITIAVMKVIIAIILTSSCISISIVAAVILSTIANTCIQYHQYESPS